MTIEPIDGNRVIVAESELEREILQTLLVYMKPDYAGYWDVNRNNFDPMDKDDKQGRIYVSWEDKSRTRQLDAFAFCKNDNFIRVVKLPKPSKT